MFQLHYETPPFLSPELTEVSVHRDFLCKDQGLYWVFRIAYAGWQGNVLFSSAVSQEMALPLRTSLYPRETWSTNYNVGLFFSPDFCPYHAVFPPLLTQSLDFLSLMVYGCTTILYYKCNTIYQTKINKY